MLRVLRRRPAELVYSATGLGALLVAAGCSPDPEPAGFVLVNVDTDLPVPSLLDRVRIDVYSRDARDWLRSFDYAVRPSDGGDAGADPARTPGATSFPLSFALQPRGPQAEALVRVRGYRETKARDYLGERYRPPSTEPAPPEPDPCDALTRLQLGESLELSAAANPGATEPAPACNGVKPKSGIAAAGIEVLERGTYEISIDRVTPDSPWQLYSDPVLYLAESCAERGPLLACNDDDDAVGPGSPSRIRVDLSAGEYVVFFANKHAATQEARLVFQRTDVADGSESPETPPAAFDPNPLHEPRLLVDGLDVTPSQEPDPGLAVDRLALVPLSRERDAAVSLMLHGSCLGTMADLATPSSCREMGDVERLEPEPLQTPAKRLLASRIGSWSGARIRDCEGSRSDDPAFVCIPGGAFTLGDSTVVESGADAAVPERVVIVSPFYLDTHEFSVARYRSLLRAGHDFTAKPFSNLQPVSLADGGVDGNYCTYNASSAGLPLYPEQEEFPLNCVSWETAREICEAVGGDLPTSVQWEYAASAAGRPQETLYPWGDEAADCGRAVFARWIEQSRGHTECLASGFGMVAVSAPGADFTSLGVAGLGGNVSEWTRDQHRSYAHPCWIAKPMTDPSCDDPGAPLRTAKGGSWRKAGAFTRAPMRFGAPSVALDDSIGFRCAYAAGGP